MKLYSQSHCKWALFLVVLSLPWVDSAEEKENKFSPINACQDGNYTVNGNTCCLCAAGQKLTKVCVQSVSDTECEHCERGKTYNSKPNSKRTCELCTSCAQPNANLEVEEECTIAKDAVCRCKVGYFSPSQLFTSCNPCKKCEETGVKNSCTGTKDTVCKEKSQGPDPTVTAVVVPVILVVVVGLVVGLCRWKKWFCFKMGEGEVEGTNGVNIELSSPNRALLNNAYLDEDGNFSTLIPAIADVVGWVEMKNIAMKDGFMKPAIENHQLNNPKDSKEQTIGLLGEWEQKHGREAPKMLVNGLLKNNKISIAEQVDNIIQSDRNSRNQPASAPPGII